ncbi:Pre-rRNA-processing protein TSR2 [Podospora australis]|uniref:Pre-rRNA-processing protein TSR2 n=1 Tax=Podospora australis TaxID=1536484 RepID=A0AAN7AG97_9PEZI|nr:Pre-rRNA-processing protein TSR2 [Podospora australis]
MASPTPAKIQETFERGVALSLHLWPALSLAVQNNWGGSDSADKRDWFAGAIVDLFPDVSKFTPAQLQAQITATSSLTTAPSATQILPSQAQEEPDQEEVETVLLQVMLDEFEVNVDDDSAYEVAESVIKVRNECLRGKFDEVDALTKRFEAKKGKKVVIAQAEDQDNETDWDTDEDGDEEDVDMDEAPALVNAPAPKKEKEEPEVDEDGFQKVTRKKR